MHHNKSVCDLVSAGLISRYLEAGMAAEWLRIARLLPTTSGFESCMTHIYSFHIFLCSSARVCVCVCVIFGLFIQLQPVRLKIHTLCYMPGTHTQRLPQGADTLHTLQEGRSETSGYRDHIGKVRLCFSPTVAGFDLLTELHQADQSR